ncbi:MAG: NAD(+) diphosphatase [Erysipelotrichales bacterium]|nr:MAG: NAD(+) diphosphatase [Erysipelotrichales bacterium]
MFQDIEPYAYHNEFIDRQPTENDYVFIINKDKVLLDEKDGELSLLQYNTVKDNFPDAIKDLIYLFSVDQAAFFLSLEEITETEPLQHKDIHVFREMKPSWLAFAGATAFHFAHWYDTHRYCGRCTGRFERKIDERAVICPSCGNVEYPRISPVVIVGIIDGDRILLTKYAKGYKRYALVAGFVEIGETLEAALQREVLEEVGLKIKNIRYYKSQPWAFSSSLLAGFFADLDGSDNVVVDTKELAEAVWMHRDALPAGESTLSLTWNMIEAFRLGMKCEE